MKDIHNNRASIRRVLVIGGALLVFGLIFDQITKFIKRKSWGEDRSAFLVVAGVLVTTEMRAYLPQERFWNYFAFACSGMPMIWGQYLRHEASKEKAKRIHLSRSSNNAYNTKGMARGG